MTRRVRYDFSRGEAARFLVVGAFNTVIGYCVGVGAYLALSTVVHVFFIGIAASAIAICISFFNQRLWVFGSRDPWWPQLKKSFLVYGVISIVGTAMLWPLIETVGLSIWLAQGIVIVACTVLSFVGQKWFVFRTL